MRKGKMRVSNGKAAIIGVCGMVLISAAFIGISGPVYKSVAGRNRPITGEILYNPGIYEGAARGYGGIVTVTAEMTETEIKDIKINAQDETPEIGKAVAVKLSKEIWLNQSTSVDSVSGATMTSNAVKKAFSECLKQAVKPGTELARTIEAQLMEVENEKAMPEVDELLASVPDGTYRHRDEMEDGNGFYNTVEVTVENGKISSLVWDAVNADGMGKRQLSQSGNYNMTEHGPKWYEQADLLTGYVLEKQTTAGLLEDAGVTDALASVSIHTGGFIDSLKKCLLLAGGDLSQAGIGELLQITPDGTYSYLSEKADDKGFRDQVQLTVKNQEITALIWDCVDGDGIGKRILSEEDNYNMTENGPKWHEQADDLAAYILANQSASGLMNVEGYTDSVASVSIYVGGFKEAVRNCLLQANGDMSASTVEGLLKSTQDGSYSYLSKKVDDNGFQDKIDLTVKDHKITALVWDAVKADGTGKRKLSADGNYTMKENGPLWYEQADALAAYLVENQSEQGLMDDAGYVSVKGGSGDGSGKGGLDKGAAKSEYVNKSDAVASVSIYIGDFLDAVKLCLAQQ